MESASARIPHLNNLDAVTSKASVHPEEIAGLKIYSPGSDNNSFTLQEVDENTPQEISYIKPQIINFSSRDNKGHSIVLEEWQAHIVEVNDYSFKAHLAQRDNNSILEAEFDIDEIPLGEKKLIKPGAIFTWAVSRNTSPSGRISHNSNIIFRRFPVWKDDINAPSEEAKQLYNFITGE